MKIAFFGHDAADAAIHRRVNAFNDDGFQVTGYMMRRADTSPLSFANIDLGRTFDGAFLQRIKQVFAGAREAAKAQNRLADTDIIYARNLDMLACAFLAKRYAGLQAKVIYECLDVHRLLIRRGPIGMILRGLERFLLKRTIGLVVSSPAFLENYFEVHHNGLYKSALIENRLVDASLAARPQPMPSAPNPAAPLNIGWVGILRCQRSLTLLCDLADQFGDEVSIQLYGKPARTEIPVFEPEIDRRENMTYFGPYCAPDDLRDIYGNLDIVWSGDFMEAGFNSLWLLPNRIYEGGYFGTPSLAVGGTQTAKWVEGHTAGFTVKEPLDRELAKQVRQLIDDRTALQTRRNKLLSLPETVFIQPKGVLAKMIEDFTGTGETA